MPPQQGVLVLQPDPARSIVVRPEVIERAPQRRHREVIGRETAVRLGRQPVVLHHPCRQSLAVEALIEQVLVHIEQDPYAVRAQRPHGRADPGEVRVVENAGLWLDGFGGHPQANRVEPFTRKHRRVVVTKPHRRGLIGRHLHHHVDAVEDDDAAAHVGEPPAAVTDRGMLGRARRSGQCDQADQGEDGHDLSRAHGSLIQGERWIFLPPPHRAKAAHAPQ